MRLNLALLSLFTLAVPVLAQNASVVGTVKDPAGAVVPKVTITLTNLETGVSTITESDSAGNYEFPAVRPGNYSLKASRTDFKTYVQTPVSLLVDQRARIDISLEIGMIAETVNVTQSVVAVQTESSSIGEVVESRKIAEMPLNGRFFLDLAMLAPGSVMPSTNNRTFLAVPSAAGAFGLNTSGAREDATNYLFDGVNLSDMAQNQITFQPNVEVIQEFKIQSNTFSAEYGRNSGVIINAVTKSGANDIHGSAFEFLRNDKLDARNFFDLPRPVAKARTGREIPPFKRNIFGESVGGPVYLPKLYNGRNKTFFFHTFEGRRQRESETLTATVPTEAQRAAVTNPVVRKLLGLIPPPNVGGTVNNLTGSAARNRLIDQVTGKIDHMAGEKNSISGTYMFQRDQRTEPSGIGVNNLPGYGDFRPARRQILALRYTRIFTPRVTNEFRAGFNRTRIRFLADDKHNPQEFGINTAGPGNLPEIRVGGNTGPLRFGTEPAFPQGRADTTFQYTDALSWIRGSHSLKFGAEARRVWNNNFNAAVSGTVDFANMDDFLNGRPNRTTVQSSAVTPGMRATAVNFFFQDDYKARPRLTFNIGLRWEYNGVPSEVANRLTMFDFGKRTLVPVGTGGFERIYKRDWNNFGPRFGFAWVPFASSKTVIRGGYGIYFDQPVLNLATNLGFNPPFSTMLVFAGSNIDLANPFAGGGTRPVPSPNLVAPDFVGPYVQQYNFNIQHEHWNTVFQIGYFGSAARHLRITRDFNQGIGGVRPIPGFGQMNINESSSRSNYNSFWASANRRLARGLTFTSSYTFGKSIDLNSVSSANPQVQNAYDLRSEKALSDFDARHRFVLSALYQLPLHSRSAVNKLVEGWGLAGIFNYQSGNPFSPISPALRSGSLEVFDRPDLVPGQRLSISNPTPNRWFNTSAFAQNAIGKFGNAGRNILTAPDLRNLDLVALKNTVIHEQAQIQFRAEFFNLTNHPNFRQPGNSLGSATFGVISGTRSVRGDLGSSRQIEFGLRLLF